MRVDATTADELHCTVLIGGPLSDHKGINRRGGGLTAPALTAKDKADIKLAAEMDLDYLAVSFPVTPPTWNWPAACATKPVAAPGWWPRSNAPKPWPTTKPWTA